MNIYFRSSTFILNTIRHTIYLTTYKVQIIYFPITNFSVVIFLYQQWTQRRENYTNSKRTLLEIMYTTNSNLEHTYPVLFSTTCIQFHFTSIDFLFHLTTTATCIMLIQNGVPIIKSSLWTVSTSYFKRTTTDRQIDLVSTNINLLYINFRKNEGKDKDYCSCA